jgi:hypothetical protein
MMPRANVARTPTLLQELLDHAKRNPETVGNLSTSALVVVIGSEDLFAEIQRERAHAQTLPYAP